VRKIPAALVIIGLATVGLAGCSLPGSSDCSSSASDAELLELVTVGESARDAEFYTPFHTDESSAATVEQGEGGAVITSEKQIVGLDISLRAGETGDPIAEGLYTGALSDLTTTFPTWGDALECADEGSRIVISMAPGDIEAESAASWGLAEDESAVAVVDVQQVALAAANGADQFNTGTGLPTVVRAPDGRPGLIIPEGSAPTDLVVQTIKKGDGAVVEADSSVLAHVLGVPWGETEAVRNTWETAPEAIVLGSDPVLAEALEGTTIGSQVMVVVPGEDGATVLVIDLLGLAPTPQG
jgi:hypothetical protein